jgi:hypothetical protein
MSISPNRQSQNLQIIKSAVKDQIGSKKRKSDQTKLSSNNSNSSELYRILKSLNNRSSLSRRTVKRVNQLKTPKSPTQYKPLKKEWDPNHTTLAWKG